MPHTPCHCKICEKDRYGDREYPSFWKTIVESKEWKAWMKKQNKLFSKFVASQCDKSSMPIFDVDESHECGWISPRHWKEFVKFIKTL